MATTVPEAVNAFDWQVVHAELERLHSSLVALVGDIGLQDSVLGADLGRQSEAYAGVVTKMRSECLQDDTASAAWRERAEKVRREMESLLDAACVPVGPESEALVMRVAEVRRVLDTIIAGSASAEPSAAIKTGRKPRAPRKPRSTTKKKTESPVEATLSLPPLKGKLAKTADKSLLSDEPLTEEQATLAAPAIVEHLAAQPKETVDVAEVTKALVEATHALRDVAIAQTHIPIAEVVVPGELSPAVRPSKNPAVVRTDEELRAREKFDPSALVGDIKRAFRFVSTQVIGREELLTQSLYAMLTREHQLIYSRAGTAKSLFAASVFGLFKDAPTFSMQLTKGTSEEALVGAVDINELKRGNLFHNVDGSIVTARFAFLDEIFDANDVALRSLLGILNERIFRKGKQQVPAVLHNAIATSNYIRATEITEAVIDRFPFRSYLNATDSPYEQLLIDDAYAHNAGRVVVPEGSQIPFMHMDFLADIVEGRVQGREITTPWHVLFLKNAIVADYMQRLNKQRKDTGKSESYLSPRTLAKTRDILNASALLRGRTSLTVDDLEDLRYMVCTIGDGENQEKLYSEAHAATIRGLRAPDRDTVDMLMEANDLFTTVMKGKGKRFDMSFLERVKCFFRISSPSELSLSRVRDTVGHIKPDHQMVQRLHTDLVTCIDTEIRRAAGTEKNALFA